VPDEKPDHPTDADGRLTDPYNAFDEGWASAEQQAKRHFPIKPPAPHRNWLRRFVEAIFGPDLSQRELILYVSLLVAILGLLVWFVLGL
jgi:hypothetical protein